MTDTTSTRRSILSGESAFARLGLRSGELLVLAVAFFFCTAIGPFFVFPSYTARMALVLFVVLPGACALIELARRGDRAAIAAATLAIWIVLAGLLSGAPRLALVGVVGREASALIAVAALGLWALGRGLSVRARQLLVPVLLAAFLFNAFVGLLQTLLAIDTGTLARAGERATGLTTNPVYFGSLMAGGMAIAASRWRDRHNPTLMLSLVAIFAFSINLSGSRVALGAAIVVLMYIAVRSGARTGWKLPVAYLVGSVASVLFTSVAGESTATSRVTTGSTGDRLDIWKYGWTAFLERPAFGVGLGRFRSAIQEHLSAAFVRDNASDDFQPTIFDAHNIVVELTVTIGVVGLVLVAVFGWYAGRRASGALAALVVVVMLSWMLQPASLSTLPIAMIALGASYAESSAAVGGTVSPRSSSSAVVGGAFAVGAVLAAWLVIADFQLKSALDRRDAQSIEDAAGWFPADPVISDLVAQAWFVEEEFDQTLRPDVLEWSTRTTDVEPDRAYWWVRLAGRQLTFGDLDGVKVSLDEALERQPWHSLSWALMELYAIRVDDPELEARAHSKLCELGATTECD